MLREFGTPLGEFGIPYVCTLDVSVVVAAGPNNVRVPRSCSVLFKFLGTKFKCQVAITVTPTMHADCETPEIDTKIGGLDQWYESP